MSNKKIKNIQEITKKIYAKILLHCPTIDNGKALKESIAKALDEEYISVEMHEKALEKQRLKLKSRYKKETSEIKKSLKKDMAQENFRSKDGKVLKIDLDIKSKKRALELLKERLSYMDDLNFFDVANIDIIELHKKTGYGCKIYLNKELSFENLIIMQLILGSDYRKEINTMINFYKLKMYYFNRLFTIKVYKNGKIRESKVTDVTDEIKDYVKNPQRRKSKN